MSCQRLGCERPLKDIDKPLKGLKNRHLLTYKAKIAH